MSRPISDFAGRIADYMATRTIPWKDEALMREAVREAVRLVLEDASDETLRLIAGEVTSCAVCGSEDVGRQVVRPFSVCPHHEYQP